MNYCLGENFLSQEKYRDAVQAFNEAIESNPIAGNNDSYLMYGRAVSSFHCGIYRVAINDCTTLIGNGQYLDTVLEKRGRCYMALRLYSKSLIDFEALLELDNSTFNKSLRDEVISKLSKSKYSNHYWELDVKSTANLEEIRKSYKKLALIHHPDKHSDAPEDEKKEQQEIFKKISVAYEILSDPKQRAKYDHKISSNFQF